MILFASDKVHVGIAPIGWTNDDMPELGGDIPFERCIREMAEAGYSGTEVGSKFPKDLGGLRSALDPLGLRVASQWFSSYCTTQPLQETVDRFMEHIHFLHALGSRVIVVSEQGHSIQGEMSTALFRNKPSLDSDGWKRLVHGLETLGRLAAERDMSIVIHHHMGTVIQSRAEVDRLMETTDSDLVSLLLDTGHIHCAGDDPANLARDYAVRIKHVHLKDVREKVRKKVREEGLSFLQGVKDGLFTVPGDGDIDFRPVVDALGGARYEGWLIVEAEQDPNRAIPLEYAKKARNTVYELTGL